MKINKKQLIRDIIIAFAIILVDQITKFLFSKILSSNNVVTIINNFFDLTLVHNYGAAWGSLSGQRILLSAISLVMSILIAIYYLRGDNDNISKISLALIFSGAIGNMIDRMFNGYVIDFIHMNFFYFFGGDFPVFNIADSAIVIGAILFIIGTLFSFKKDGKSN